MAAVTPISESDILADVLAPRQGGLPPELARTLIGLKFSERAVQRMNELAVRNNSGSLSDPERDELEKYVRVGTFVNLLQAKAQATLQSAG